ncbi:MAG: TaqI-like C-terminal specificity domain-containing protein, partial [Ktedonobacteraceae bacterium]
MPVFHWHLAFPDVFHVPTGNVMPENVQTGWSGGFNVMLGNPPYVFGEHHDKKMKACFQTAFHVAKGQYNTYWLFIEQALHLINPLGKCALVVPDALLARDETQTIRELLLQKGLREVCDCGTLFEAGVSTAIFTVDSKENSEEILGKALEGHRALIKNTCSKSRFLADSKHRFLIYMSEEEARILSYIEKNCEPLQNFVKISRGEEVGKKGTFSEGMFPILAGEDISRYVIRKPSRFLHTLQKEFSLYQSPKIVILKTGHQCIASLEMESAITMQSVYNIHITVPKISYEVLLALLNSNMVDYYIYKTFTSYKRLFPQLNQSTIESIPVPLEIMARHEKLCELVANIQWLRENVEVRGRYGSARQKEQIRAIEREINDIVY